MYLFHMLVWKLLQDWRPAELAAAGTPFDPDVLEPFFGTMAFDAPLRFALAVGLTFAVSWSSYHLYEKQFLTLKRHVASTAGKRGSTAMVFQGGRESGVRSSMDPAAPQPAGVVKPERPTQVVE